jgi:hypothetical protein
VTKEELYTKHPQYKCRHALRLMEHNALLHHVYVCSKCKLVKFSTKKL